MRVIIRKQERRLYLLDGQTVLLCAPVALGRHTLGKKQREGDGRTPEGTYHICLIKPNGKYGRSLGLDYPSPADAAAALQRRAIDPDTCQTIADAAAAHRRPPWGTPMGGEIYIHEGGVQRDWTQGCIALNAEDMDILFPYHAQITQVDIFP
ncbi:MAG TPA: L,D-transpeptidase family protein [Candidatus Limiplasma sp.]|nr:L,D-transpeptidase family protein [Candidatus Limiplasma sp.]